jgi:SNF2 family DNA or RNA helicase
MPKLKFKPFQLDDYSRAAMRDGCILAHDTGLGKSLSAFAIPMVKDNVRRVLIVAPESLHRQLKETALDFFDVMPLPLMSQEEFYDWGLDRPAPPLAPGEKPQFFVTTYTALGHNGADEWLADKDEDGFPVEVEQLQARRRAVLHEIPNAPTVEDASQNIGYTSSKGVTCVWTPSLARLIRIHDAFDFVVVDEGVRLQSNDAHIATGVRMLCPRYRLVLSATPIKNRLESLFWLAWWAAGGTAEGNPRWPYAGTIEDREKFASEHLLTDKYLTREREKYLINNSQKRQSVTRRSARITNLHHLWKVVAPIVLRRRKANCGEDIVTKTTHVTRVKPGHDQWRIYNHYLNNPPERKNALSAAGAQLTLLRQATVAPYTDLMQREGKWSQYVLNPKKVAILSIVENCLKRGEQVVIGSSFNEFGTAMHKLLTDAGIWTCLLDGRTDAAKRGRIARQFKDKQYSVMIAGVHAMGEGHSFDQCPNLVLPSLDWAYDINSQFVDRVWRMTSTKPVNVYILATEGSVDEYLLEVYKEKDDSSQLALDGSLTALDMDESSVEELLEKAITGYKGNATTINESDLQNEWPVLRTRLANAQNSFALSVNSIQQECA